MSASVRHEIVAMLPRLRRFARGLCGSATEADDLVQSACEKALRGIDSWQPGTKLDSWMFRILRNLWIDQVRKRRAEVQGDAELAAELPGEDGRRTSYFLLELKEVRAAIAALAEQQREVLVLVCIEDRSYREAAEILGVPTGTVMSRLARARAALVTALNGEADEMRAATGKGAREP